MEDLEGLLKEQDKRTDKILNPYGEYVVRYARNHGMSFDQACAEPMCKARLDYFEKTGL